MIRKILSDRRDAAAAISGVDQRIRGCLQALWLSLPRDRANLDDLEDNFRRLCERALRDFKEDMDLFPPDDKPVYRSWPHEPPK